MIRLTGLFLVALSLAITPLGAAPSVFVQSSKGSAFWNSDKNVGRVLDKQAGPVTAKTLTKYLADNSLFDPFEVCALSAAGKDSYVGIDKEAAAELRQFDEKGWATYRVAATSPNGRSMVGQSILFETCDGTLKGAAVLAFDAKTGEVLMFKEVTDVERPHWFAFVHPKTDKGDSVLFSYSSCLECGASTAVYFDVTRGRIYTEYNGH